METANVVGHGIEAEQAPVPAPKPKAKRSRAPPKKEAKKMAKPRAKRETTPKGKPTVFPKGGAKVGIAVPPDIARELRQYRAKLESKSGDRVTMAEAVSKAVRIATAGLR
jgi:hypothetical protein